MFILKTFLLILTHVILAEDMWVSRFLRTKVIEEEETCDISVRIEEVAVTNRVDCLKHCSRNVNCSKVLFCEHNDQLTCRLYEDGEKCVTLADNCQCHRKLSSCNKNSCVCPRGYYGEACENIIQDCSEAQTRLSNPESGLYFIKPPASQVPLEVQCTYETNFGAQMAILVRQKACSKTNFNRTWTEYENGFGSPSTEYWIGLKKFFEIKTGNMRKMRLVFTTTTNQKCITLYFINRENGDGNYKFKTIFTISQIDIPYCGDDWEPNDYKFSTYDNDNSLVGCPMHWGSGGWFGPNLTDCMKEGNIFGPYFNASIWPNLPFSWSEVNKMEIDI